MIPVAALGDYLHDLGLDAAVPVFTPDLMDIDGLSDRAVFAVPTTGPGPLLEQEFVVPTFQLRVRGPQDQGVDGAGYTVAEDDAKSLDVLLLTADLPVTIDGRHVTRLGRTGGGPTFFRRDAGGRSHFTCNYYFEITVS
jgi:hypothetical protein